MSRSDGASGAPEQGDAELSPGQVDWAKLPDAVRSRLAELAATAVGAMPVTDVPVPLRRLARFTPAKRAKLGGPALTAELEASAAFRTAVVAWWEEHRPGELTTAADDPLIAAAAALLNDDPDAGEAVAAAARRGEAGELRAERDAALSRVDKLTVELERLRGELTEARAQARTAGQHRDHEYQQLRRRVSEQGAKLRAAHDAQAAAERAVEELRRSAERDLAAATAERDRERARAEAERRRADRAAAEVAAARQAAREARKADEMRLSLLMDTLGGALTGLRRELALGGGDRVRATSSPVPAPPGVAPPSAASSSWTPCSPCRRCIWWSTGTTSARPAIPSSRWPTSAPGSSASSAPSPRVRGWRSPSCSTVRV